MYTSTYTIEMNALKAWVENAKQGTRTVEISYGSTGVWCIVLKAHNGKGAPTSQTRVAEAEGDSLALAYVRIVGAMMQSVIEANNAR
jgi:hypothetical protein